MSCQFRLEQYLIDHILVAQNDRYDASLQNHTGDVATVINVAPNQKNPSLYRVILDVQVKPTVKQENEFFPYQVAIKGRGFYAVKGANSPEESDRLLRVNGAAILYGLLRAQVAQITAQSLHGQFLLPTMNFVEAYENAKKTGKKPKTPKKRRSKASN